MEQSDKKWSTSCYYNFGITISSKLAPKLIIAILKKCPESGPIYQIYFDQEQFTKITTPFQIKIVHHFSEL